MCPIDIVNKPTAATEVTGTVTADISPQPVKITEDDVIELADVYNMLNDIRKQLVIMNMYLWKITDMQIEPKDIEAA